MIGVSCTSFFDISDMLGCIRLKLDGWVELGPTCFLSDFWRVVMIGDPCKSFFVFSDMLGCTQLSLTGWVELGPTNIYVLIFWRVLIVGIPCTGFFSFFRWVGRAWSNFKFFETQRVGMLGPTLFLSNILVISL